VLHPPPPDLTPDKRQKAPMACDPTGFLDATASSTELCLLLGMRGSRCKCEVPCDDARRGGPRTARTAPAPAPFQVPRRPTPCPHPHHHLGHSGGSTDIGTRGRLAARGARRAHPSRGPSRRHTACLLLLLLLLLSTAGSWQLAADSTDSIIQKTEDARPYRHRHPAPAPAWQLEAAGSSSSWCWCWCWCWQ
jgi:hypothetical protein